MLPGNRFFENKILFMGTFLLSLTSLLTAGTLPDWTSVSSAGDSYAELAIPDRLQTPDPGYEKLKTLVLELAPDWQPDWQKAALDLKNLIVTAKTKGPNVRVGIEGSESQINNLMAFDLAAYIDGYVFVETPFIPEADETGKLWQRAKTAEKEVLTTLVDAASLGIELVIFEDTVISDDHRAFLDRVAAAPAGALDIQPDSSGLPDEDLLFFFDAATGNYYLSVYAPADRTTVVMFSLSEGTKVTARYPENARFRAQQYGQRTELTLNGDRYYFFFLEPGIKSGSTQTLEIVGKESIDPYELVVQNQVFKDREKQKFKSLKNVRTSATRPRAAPILT